MGLCCSPARLFLLLLPSSSRSRFSSPPSLSSKGSFRTQDLEEHLPYLSTYLSGSCIIITHWLAGRSKDAVTFRPRQEVGGR